MNAFSLLSLHRLSMALVLAAGLAFSASPAWSQSRGLGSQGYQPQPDTSRSHRGMHRGEYRDPLDDREGFSKSRSWTRDTDRDFERPVGRTHSRDLPEDAFGVYDRSERTPTFRTPIDDRRSTPALRDWEVIDQYDSVPVRDRDWPQTEIRRRLPSTNSEVLPLPRQPVVPASGVKSHDERPSIQEELTSRYQDAALLRFASTLPAQQGLTLYGEVLSYITDRHLQPPAPQAMAHRGLYNLSQALQNTAFLHATRIQTAQASGVQQVLAQLSQQPVARNEDAIALLRQTISATQAHGLPASVVTLEFIEGAMDGLDRFSSFLPEESARSQNQQLGESLVGIGVTIEAAKDGIQVVKTIAGSPAAEAGLQKGDLLVTINGRSLQGLTIDGAISMITGPEGSVAVLGVDRSGRQAQVSVVRRRVETHSVTDVQMLDRQNGIGYAKLEIFGAKSAAELEAALQGLHQQGMQAFILDLRGNPGGLLTTAIELSDMFLPQGTIVSTRGRNSSDDSDTQAHREKTWKVPLVVLIDGNSASASEIMAAAIQDNGRGVIVGRHSYGKGTVQTLFPLKTASCSLRLTTARFYSPAGRPMAGQGIEPDVASQEGTDAQGREQDVLAGISAARQLLNR